MKRKKITFKNYFNFPTTITVYISINSLLDAWIMKKQRWAKTHVLDTQSAV